MRRGDIQEMISLWARIYPVYMQGAPYVKNWGRDGKIMQTIKESYGDKSDDLIRDFFKYWKSGVNKWVSEKAPYPHVMLGCIGDLQVWILNKKNNEEILR